MILKGLILLQWQEIEWLFIYILSLSLHILLYLCLFRFLLQLGCVLISFMIICELYATIYCSSIRNRVSMF
ncbi:hypothetical protein RIF29_42403 [Crotalaria pallida]|uniref:Uncharacterized protein n=1 Tax=Crotalaria pallida TaxID=3830 RepID=A0AAN9E7I2_CROPI